ncbi:MAG: tetratricopeptide repeat protein [Terriglobales bacterium]
MHRRLLLTALCAAALHSRAAAADQWVEVRSSHFSVVTDAGESRGRDLALRFEQMRAVFATLLLRNRVNLPVPLQIVAFQNSSAFRRFLPLWQGKPVEASGLFQPGEDRNFIVLDLSSNESLPAVFHEYAHMLLSGNYPRTQPWFDEGFAEYFSTIRIEAKEVEVGRPPISAPLLQGAAPLPVTELFAVGRDSKIYNQSGGRRTVFYAESWLLVRYLFENGKLDQVGSYFDLVHNQRLPVAEAIRRAFGMEPAQLDRILREAANPVRSSTHTFEAPAGIDDTGYSVTKLDEADSRAVLADLHLHSPGYTEQAIREFQEVLALSPNHAAAHCGLGYAYLSKQQLGQAGEHFRQAAAVDSSDARVHYYFALLMNRESLAVGGRIEDPWTMKREAETAISLAPDFADAYNLLAAAEASIGNLESAIAAMKKAVRLNPRNDLYAANLAQYDLLAQKWDDAAALFEYLKASEDPQIAASADEDLKRLPSLRHSPPPVVARRERPQDWSEYDEPQWRRRTPAPAPPAAREETAAAQPDTRPIKFLKGKLLQVDCSQPPAAVLTVLAGKTSWKLRARDSRALVLVGANAFSCGWRNRDVSVNYRESAPAEGDLVSLEVN